MDPRMSDRNLAMPAEICIALVNDFHLDW